ncbi:nucleoside-diphosphate sugar epimerase/dehydratase [Erythrobacter aurantius]|uniref:nucleoside-diphosphate sugar epimerase/dehydratase n=1 Tax=Erythrobacter aurantius TaxID=2909249 RepID=UPI00207A81DA|nr:nucleoside-diphosphate sugar epimerase/dehydratase [Erythrobacter aurantius]
MLDNTSTAMPFALRARAAVDRADELTRGQKRILVAVGDAVLCVVAVWFAYFLRLGEWRLFTEDVAKLTVGALAFWFLAAGATGVYREFFRFSGSGTMMRIARAIGIMLIPMVTLFLIWLVPGVPRTLSVLQPIIFFLLLVLSRMMIRYVILDLSAAGGFNGETRRILIYGAGAPGMRLASAMRHEPGLRIEGYVDDDELMRGQRLDRLKVYHSSDLPALVRNKDISDIYLALPRLTRSAKQRIMESLGENPVQIMALPNVRDIIEGGVSINEFREIDISDLLGRSPIAPDPALMAQTITGKTVVVTGAGGSIGSELCTQIARLAPARLVLLELGEFALYSVDRAIREQAKAIGADFEIVPELCNVSDRASVSRIIERHRPDTVFHAAAYKHVPLVEANVIGGARNNIIGTLNTLQAALACEVSNFILISTDKAVRPTNIMGATKRVCEQILQAHAARPDKAGKTVMTMVRFGNVLGSSGSVVPLFKRQIRQGGPITITDRRINRYFMTIPEAAELVIQAGAMAQGGEVYVLDMGNPVKIIDLARTMIRLSGLKEKSEEHPDGDIAIAEIGLRPGEKLYEELLIGDNPLPTPHPRIMQARESHMPYDDLVDALSHLVEALDAGNAAAVRTLIAEMVPEYVAAQD